MVKLEYICDRCGEHTTTTRSDMIGPHAPTAIDGWHSAALDYDGKDRLKDICPPCFAAYQKLEDELIMHHKTSLKQWLMELKS